MAESPYLLFKLYDSLYGIDIAFIHEIVELPELKCLAETPPYFAGLLNFHGEIIPILDLGVCLGYSPRRYSLDNLVIILKGSTFHFGFIVCSILNVQYLSSMDLLSPGSIEKSYSAFLPKVTKYEEQMVFILDPDSLIKKIETLLENDSSQEKRIEFQTDSKDQLAFSIRAQRLMEPTIDIKPTESLIPLIVVMLEQEYFGIDPEIIQEFFPLASFTPIPNASPHLLGFMNFRGTVLTLIDIQPLLKKQKLKINSQTQVLIVNINQLTVGVVVDQVIEIIHLRPTNFQPTPLGIEGTMMETFTKHTIFYGKDFLSVLDLIRILESLINEGSAAT